MLDKLKSELIEENKIVSLALSIGCEASKLQFTYLGVRVGQICLTLLIGVRS